MSNMQKADSSSHTNEIKCGVVRPENNRLEGKQPGSATKVGDSKSQELLNEDIAAFMPVVNANLKVYSVKLDKDGNLFRETADGQKVKVNGISASEARKRRDNMNKQESEKNGKDASIR